MKKIILGLLYAFALCGDAFGFITVTNTTIYPIDLWIADPRLIDATNPIIDPQARITILPGSSTRFEPFFGVPVFVINVLFHPQGMKKSCYSDPALLARDGANYEIYAVAVADHFRVYVDVMPLEYDSWTAIMRVQA